MIFAAVHKQQLAHRDISRRRDGGADLIAQKRST
jgi:hypothetical protein